MPAASRPATVPADGLEALGVDGGDDVVAGDDDQQAGVTRPDCLDAGPEVPLPDGERRLKSAGNAK